MKNKLLYYEGGGYDGCYWEWNYCFWDADGVWHNFYSSGRKGADTEIEALEIIENRVDELKAKLVDLTDANRFKQFQQNNNAHLVLDIAQELNENYNYEIEIECTECGHSFIADRNEDDAAIDNYSIICHECLSNGTCDCCGEYVGEAEVNRYYEDSDDDVGNYLAELGCYAVCNGCFEYNKEELRLRKLADLRFQSFCTGKPDMFCDELREIW